MNHSPRSSIRVASGHCSRGPSTARTGRSRSEGVALTVAGHELSRVVELEPVPQYTEDLKRFFQALELEMCDVTDLL